MWRKASLADPKICRRPVLCLLFFLKDKKKNAFSTLFLALLEPSSEKPELKN